MTTAQESRPGWDSEAAVDLDDNPRLAPVSDKIRAMALRSADAAPPLTPRQAQVLGSALGHNSGGGSS